MREVHDITNRILTLLETRFSWLYIVAMALFIIFCLGVACSKYGKIRLGQDDSRPEFSTISWFAMLFCAGMGIGLVFWGISEPLSHFANPEKGIQPGSAKAALFSIRSCFMHWGIHSWSAYAVIGLGLAYFHNRKEKPGLISSLLIPLLGEERVRGNIGRGIDILAVIVTVGGVASSLGMGCLQICSGLNFLYGIPNNKITWLIVIVVIGCIYLLSATTGVDRGIQLLSNFNLVLALFLLLFVFFLGPSTQIIETFITGIGQYLSYFIEDSLNVVPFGDKTWIYKWRIFYWAWWISWTPFVGMFIARISKGRTIREYIVGVILVPSAASMVWFTTFGVTSFQAVSNMGLEEIRAIVEMPEIALFQVFHRIPFGNVLSMIAMLVLFIFFITSADSATFVLGSMTSKGSPNPPNHKKILWGVTLAVIAYVLIVCGGVKMLQTVAIIIAFPFSIIMICICVSILKALKNEENEGT